MSPEQPTNAVVQYMRASYALLSSADVPPDPDRIRANLTDDFVFEDRRRRTAGANFGTVDASQWPAFMDAIFAVTSERVVLSMSEVLAVRGQRLAAYVEVVAYGDVETHVSIQVPCLDSRLERLQRLVLFDGDDVDAAIAELDRIQAEIDD